MFDSFLASIFDPLLNLVGTFWFVVLISLAVSLLTVIIYKYTTNQTMMKGLKEDIKKLQGELKKHMSNQAKALSVQKEMMDKQMRMMSHSLTPTFITLLPIILLFGWLNSSLAYVPIAPDTQFTISVAFDDYVGNAQLTVPKDITIVDNATKPINGTVDWRLSGKEGDYLFEWNVGDKNYTKEVIISSNHQYASKLETINDGIVKSIQINYKDDKIFNLLGWKLGWFGTYFIFALLFSIILRKVMNVY